MFRRDFILTFAPAPVFDARAAIGQAEQKLANFDDLMSEIIRDQGLPGGSLSLAEGGRLVYARGFGWASVDGRLTECPLMMFGLASGSKPITVIAILKLVGEGRLGLDDPAFDVLRDITPLPGDRIDPLTEVITMHQLPNYASGYTQQPDKAEVSRRLDVPRPRLREDDVIKAFLGQRHARRPRGHRPFAGNVDWAVAFNGGREVPGRIGVDADVIRRIHDAVIQTTDWADGDAFPELFRGDPAPSWPSIRSSLERGKRGALERSRR